MDVYAKLEQRAKRSHGTWLARKRAASAILRGSASASGETPARVDPSSGWMPAWTAVYAHTQHWATVIPTEA